MNSWMFWVFMGGWLLICISYKFLPNKLAKIRRLRKDVQN
jgi:hypothetical protein